MAGIYIHIPFCKQKCTYCDFHFSTTFEIYREDMIQSILSEITLRKDYLSEQVVQTIYFGGGTPSLLDKRELGLIIAKVNENYRIIDEPEITLEANPDDIAEDKLAIWKQSGVNRLSIGLQSFKESDLRWMNRAHTVQESNQCISIAQNAGFNNLTVDLMYGLPDLKMEEWKSHIQKLIDLNISHISAYCLTIEKNTVLDNWVNKGKIKPPTEDVQSEQFLMLLYMLEKNGYEQYEISNFCKNGAESKHNSNYWKGEYYIGIGPSAHSFNGTSRSWNIANNSKYIKAIQSGINFSEVEELTYINQFNEYLLTGLRTKYGVSLDRLEKIHSISNEFTTTLKSFSDKNWCTIENELLTLTKEGKLMADYIASELFIA
ncbi:MAG: radical SAM family heme chaperone HemW [Flavobacteriales bacterium]|nr:radical SAM family heme chaperone HemW [Flavobacteriales bacterium]